MEKKTARIRDKHPWFWTLEEIISERPNLVPTGISNNDGGYDLDIPQNGDSFEGGDYLEESSRMSDCLVMGADGAYDASGKRKFSYGPYLVLLMSDTCLL